jgi:hypothetical protein
MAKLRFDHDAASERRRAAPAEMQEVMVAVDRAGWGT